MRAPLLRGACLGSFLFLILAGQLSRAEELTPETSAKIKEEQRAAVEKVNQAHGDRKSSELSTDERRAIIQEQAAAEASVLEKHGVSAKAFARYTATEPMADRAREKAELDRLEAKKGPKAEGPPTPEGATGGNIELHPDQAPRAGPPSPAAPKEPAEDSPRPKKSKKKKKHHPP